MPAPPVAEIDWTAPRRADWERWLTAAGRSSLEQCWAYGDAAVAAHGLEVSRAVLRLDGAPVGIVQVVRRRLLGFAALCRILRGPLWLDNPPDAAARFAAYRALRRAFRLRDRQLLLWLPELPDGSASHDLMRGLGMRRMVTGYGSAWLDLSPGEAALRAGLHGKWRNALRAGEAAGLQVRLSRHGGALDASLAACDAFRRRKRFVGPSGRFIRALAEAAHGSEHVLSLTAAAAGEPVAGVVLARHGAAATYLASWTSPEGRRAHAHNLLLWRGIAELCRNGAGWLDLGGIDTESAPGVARFKLGLGARPFRLVGTYL